MQEEWLDSPNTVESVVLRKLLSLAGKKRAKTKRSSLSKSMPRDDYTMICGLKSVAFSNPGPFLKDLRSIPGTSG
jgi:hypothetical protein